MEEDVDTHRKALKINLDPRWYGTFAEIGAGQEVVRWFFRVGGGAGTISKSISAYDMQVSDAIYGQTKRYVCRERLQAMLDYEHHLNLERLRDARGDTTQFFAFADTVSARSYRGGNECHGWMGVKFQARPHDEDSQIIIHVRMLDNDAALQQEALGIVGVNLLYGAFYLHHNPEELIESLLHILSPNRIEIDLIEFSGIEFRHIDNRLMSMKLVEVGLSNAAMFSANGTVLQPSEVLRKKPILVERGSFRPVCHVNVDMLRCAHEKFCAENGFHATEVIQLMELTMRDLRVEGEVDRRDFLARAEVMASVGMTVLISNYFRYYRLAAYLSEFTKNKIALVMGAGSLMELFDEHYYTALDGGILESFGRLFKNDLKIYVYPLRNRETGKLITAENMEVAAPLLNLYEYLIDRRCIAGLENFDEKYLGMFSRDVLKKIKERDDSWEKLVPEKVSEAIKRRRFFDYQP
jgi:hypothetical protein